MKITVFFTDSGLPKTLLSPVISIWTIDGTLIADDVAMTEIGGGSYYFDFVAYDETQDYTYRADGGSVLADYERYMYGSNDSSISTTDKTEIITKIEEIFDEQLDDHTTPGSAGAALKFLRQMEEGEWRILNGYMYFYDALGVEVAKFRLLNQLNQPDEVDVFRRVPV